MPLTKLDKFRRLEELRRHAHGRQVGDHYILQIPVNEEGVTGLCAFCGKRHTHGKGSGHKIRHCVEDTLGFPVSDLLVFQNDRNQLFFACDGYELCSRND